MVIAVPTANFRRIETSSGLGIGRTAFPRPGLETISATRGGGSHAGEVEADGDVLKFTAICGGSNVEGVGRYRWTLDGNALHLDLMGRDECSGRSAILEDATYKRSG